MHGGWFKVHRRLKDSYAGSSAASTGLWIHILMRVNRKPAILKNGEELKAGEVLFSSAKFAKDMGMSRKVLRRFLDIYEREGMIKVVKRDRNGTTLSVCNWGTYQDSGEAEGQERNSNGTATEQQWNSNGPRTRSNNTYKKDEKDKNSSATPTRRKPPSFSDADMDSARSMLGLIRGMNPSHRQPNLDSWAEAIRKMREIDQHTSEQIDWLFRWANADDFWKQNILSPDKLRKQWDKLLIRAKSQHTKETDPLGNKAAMAAYLEKHNGHPEASAASGNGGPLQQEAQRRIC